MLTNVRVCVCVFNKETTTYTVKVNYEQTAVLI